MIIANGDEEERSHVWRVVTATTSLIIIVIVAFFVVKLFTTNPVTGTWKHQGSDMTFAIDKSKVVITSDEILQGETVTCTMDYALDTDAKTLGLHLDQGALDKTVKALDGKMTEDALREKLQNFETTYGYSVDGTELTLTDQEYGDQMVFDKQ